jgi:hypothetical protein
MRLFSGNSGTAEAISMIGLASPKLENSLDSGTIDVNLPGE